MMNDTDDESDFMELPLRHNGSRLLDSANDNFSELNEDLDGNLLHSGEKDQSSSSLTKKVRFESNEGNDFNEQATITEHQGLAAMDGGPHQEEESNEFILHAPGHIRLSDRNRIDSDLMLADRSQTSSTVSNKMDVEDLIRAASEVNEYMSQNLDKINSFRSELLSSTDFTRDNKLKDPSNHLNVENTSILANPAHNISGSLSNFELSDNEDSERDSDELRNYVMNREILLSSSTSLGSTSDFGRKSYNSSTSLSKLLNNNNFEGSQLNLNSVQQELLKTQQFNDSIDIDVDQAITEIKQRKHSDHSARHEDEEVMDSSTVLLLKYIDDDINFEDVTIEKALEIYQQNLNQIMELSKSAVSKSDLTANEQNPEDHNDNEAEKRDEADNDESSTKKGDDIRVEGPYEIESPAALNFTMKSKPSVSAEIFLGRIQNKCEFGPIIYLAAAYLLQILFLTRDNPDSNIRVRLKLRENEIHRLIISTVRVSAKLVEDFVHSHEYFSKVCGVSKKLLSKLEVSLIMCIKNERLMITKQKLTASQKILDELQSAL